MSHTHELEPPSDFSHLDAQSSFEEVLGYAAALSARFALPGGMPVPPQGRHFERAGQEGWGVSPRTVIRAVGSISCLQEALGFVMPKTTDSWDDERFIEHGTWVSHVLGSAEEPAAPQPKDFQQLSYCKLAPHPRIIRNRFGSWDAFLDKLGYVTPTTLERWTDEDWIANGQWLSHILGSAEAPHTPNRNNLMAAARVLLVPPYSQITEKYTGLFGYQAALGFGVSQAHNEHTTWDRDTFVQNGIWFSHALGSPEHPVIPTAPLLLEGRRLGLCPPVQAIQAEFETLPKYQDALGFVTTATLKRWKHQDWIDNGVWLSHMLGSAEEPVMPTGADLLAGTTAGISPNVEQVVEMFGGVGAYQDALGFQSRRRFTEWRTRNFLHYGLRVLEATDGRIPMRSDYDAADGPRGKYIARRFGSLEAFHERLGLRDYSTATAEELLAFGLRWRLQHERFPSGDELTEHSRYGRAPNVWTLQNTFGGYARFVERVEALLPRYHALAAELTAEQHIGEATAYHLLQEFRDSDDYARGRQQLARLLGVRFADNPEAIAQMTAIFGDSRVTIQWHQAAYVNFGKQAFGNAAEPQECRERLAILNAAGLSPLADDIAEVFGSVDQFIAAVLQAP